MLFIIVFDVTLIRHYHASIIYLTALPRYCHSCSVLLLVNSRYLTDPRPVVRESCEVALDMSEYENSPEFQYANTLHAVEA